ncbi:MAG: Tex-like N-terminal domain-containing protein [Oligoflexia bacterium]|nr:Tex-like N-terminal domain-containing protein [Oligoflexia bacterium]
MNFESWFKDVHPEVPAASALAVLSLTAEGSTLPFIARYRKEQTGNLNEVAIQAVIDSKEKWDQILHRQKFILEQIEAQGKLTDELKSKIGSTFQLEELDDIYLPYKLKRKTKAQQAREAGLEPLADWIWNCSRGTEVPQPGQTLAIWAFTFRNEKAGINDADSAIDGAQNILIERISETRELRQLVRTALMEQGVVRVTKGEKAKPNSKYEGYFAYEEPIRALLLPQNSHRYLAIRRGWMEEELRLALGGSEKEPDFEQKLLDAFTAYAYGTDAPPLSADTDPAIREVLAKSGRLALKAHVLPSMENEAHKALKEVADEASIRVFSENVRKLLLASPLGPKAVLGVDPGVRTGCKLAVIDGSGKYIASTVIHLAAGDNAKDSAKKTILEVAKNAELAAIAVGNGTHGRETETFLRTTLKEAGINVPVVMVSEAGASVYSASEVAREEFPDLDVTVRGAISIARRLQDPLAELVKVDPKSIGVGQYQHDVAPNSLKRSLDFVVDSCVNTVGVNINTASYHLLAHVSGIGDSLAKSIVEFRGEKGIFKSRQELMDVPRFSKKAFEQAAGFLRIPEGNNPLDNTGVHPERYPLLESLAQELGKSVQELMGPGVRLIKEAGAHKLKNDIGEFTYRDMIEELEKPGRDPRDPFVPFSFRDDIFEVKDLQPGMICPGIVTNVTNFGAFVDIGVHQDGLVHISQLSARFVKDPREAVSPGDQVKVKVLEVNREKNQISLTMKIDTPKQAPREAKPRAAKPAPKPIRGASAPKATPETLSPHAIKIPAPGSRSARPHATVGGRPSHPRPAPAPRNNPFGALAALRKDLKPKG